MNIKKKISSVLKSKTHEIEKRFSETDIPTIAITNLAEISGAFDFLADEREDIFSPLDIKNKH